jgi:hypothetical protein
MTYANRHSIFLFEADSGFLAPHENRRCLFA